MTNKGKKDMLKKVEHLKMIQEVIGRMAKNSFSIKSWNLTLVSGLMVYALNENVALDRLSVIILLCAIIIAFCFLDAYYLMLEKSYRNYYSFIATKKEEDIDFLMEFPPKEKKSKPLLLPIWKSFLSPSIWLYYAFIVLLPIVLLIII